MSQSEIYQANKPKSKRIAPIWRGIGCVMILALTLGAYWLGGVVIAFNQKTPFIPVPMPRNMGVTLGPIDLPVGIALANPARPPQGRVVVAGPLELTVGTLNFFLSWIQLAMAAVVDVVVYGFAAVVYSLANPIRLGPKDAPPVRPRKGRPKSLIR